MSGETLELYRIDEALTGLELGWTYAVAGDDDACREASTAASAAAPATAAIAALVLDPEDMEWTRMRAG